MNDRLQSALRQLRLSGLAQTLDVRLQEASGHQLSHAEFLDRRPHTCRHVPHGNYRSRASLSFVGTALVLKCRQLAAWYANKCEVALVNGLGPRDEYFSRVT